MTCTIIIYDYDSLAFLKATMRQVLKYKHPKITQHIIISEQGSRETYEEIVRLYGDVASIYNLQPLGSGYAVDWIMRNHPIKDEFICTLDVDAIPIHKNWLYVPIMLIKEFGYTFAGVHADIDSAYGGGFFCMCQYFRVGRTADYKRLSLWGGFTKFDRRKLAGFQYNDGSWSRGWSDDGVIAHWWDDQQGKSKKFAFCTDKYLYVAPTEGRGGRNTDDLVFHFAFSYNWKRVANKEAQMGEDFLEWMRRIEEGFTDELLQEMLDRMIPLEYVIRRREWNGEDVVEPLAVVHKRIEELKHE